MNRDIIEAMISLTYDAPCRFFCEKGESLYFYIESRSSKNLNKVDGEIICDNFIETDLSGQIKNCYDFALKVGEYIVVEINKQCHGKSIRDKIVVYNSNMDILSEFVESEQKKYCLRLFNDEIRCIKENLSGIYYNLDGNILQEAGE